jgi:hypothetical protein
MTTMLSARAPFQPVGDNNDRLALHQLFKCLLNQMLFFRIRERGRLIEHDDGESLMIARAIAMRWRSPPDSGPLSCRSPYDNRREAFG